MRDRHTIVWDSYIMIDFILKQNELTGEPIKEEGMGNREWGKVRN